MRFKQKLNPDNIDKIKVFEQNDINKNKNILHLLFIFFYSVINFLDIKCFL